MKGQGIRNRLIGSFFFVIALLAILNASLFFVQVTLIGRYQDITDNMITEYQVITTTDNLVSSFNEAVKSIQDPQQMAKYDALLQEIDTIFAKLNTTIVSETSKAAYVGLRNTVQNLISGLNSGIEEAKTGDISNINTDYASALQKKDFVHQNGATLIFDELDYTEQIQAAIAYDERMSEIFGGLLIFLLSVGAVIYAIFFSKKLTAPFMNLTKLAKNIAGGDLDATVDADLLTATDEVGSLANSFNIMLQSLRKNIYELDSEKKIVEEKVRLRTRELLEERAQLLASINGLSLGFILLDIGGAMLLSNRQAQELFPSGDLTFASFGKLFVPSVDVGEINRLATQKQSYELQEAKLEEKSFRIMATPVVISRPDNEDEIIGSVVLLEDITREKMLEQSKNAFLAIAAHEMRTPLTIIRGNTELLLDEPFVTANAGFKGSIESILRSAIRLLGIVNDFLDVQNLEGGRVSLNIEPVDIVAFLTEAAHDISVLTQQKGLTLVFHTPPDFGTVMINVDKYRFQQIITNILGNAIHYTEHGGITVSFQREEKTVKILFADTGIGIAPEEQGRLFKKFETGRAFIRSKEYGSGLGLYIARFLARLLGGDLTLEKSEVGKGSVFCLTLPLGDVAKK